MLPVTLMATMPILPIRPWVRIMGDISKPNTFLILIQTASILGLCRLYMQTDLDVMLLNLGPLFGCPI